MALTLHYEKRDKTTKPGALRRTGRTPAIFYGKRTPSTPISLSLREFEKVWKKAGKNTVVTLAAGGDEVPTLIYEAVRHPVTGVFQHIDFYAFEKGQKLRVKVPIEFIGVSPAVKDLGGVLVKVIHNLEIEASPQDLPQKVEVDISPLAAFGSVILAKQIILPAGVTLQLSPEDVVASVYEPKEEAVEEAPADLSQIEVAKKGKEEKGSEEAPTADTAAGTKEAKKEEGGKEEKKEGKREEKK
jgi:large subunit ribosomal protein L25